jgi:hypothetical protein
MATTDVRCGNMSDTARTGSSNPKLEVVDSPVSDLDRLQAPRRCRGHEDDRTGRRVRPEREPWTAWRARR